MAEISAEALLHFTRSMARLTGILKNDFHPRYNLEKYRLGRHVVEAAFPLISFCDIPLSRLKNHISTYGYYGIGMTRAWAEKKGLNPILYLREGATLSRFMGAVMDGTAQTGTNEAVMISALRNIRAYIKQFEGDFYRDGRWIRNVRFYNEREWRYVPEIGEGELPAILKKKDFMDRAVLRRAEAKLKKYRLDFEPDDIKYIIVRNEREILNTVKILKKIEEKYSPETVEILTSRILTSEQILRDF